MSPLLSRMRAGDRSVDPLEVASILAGLIALVSYGVVVLTQDVTRLEQFSPRGDADNVVVVTGEGSADALVADSLGDAVLSVPDLGLTSSLIDEFRRLNPARVVILGGLDAVSPAAAADLAALTTAPVTRIAGEDRYATAAQAALLTFAAPVQEVLIAPSDTETDGATAAGPATGGIPVLLVTHGGVPAATSRALHRLQPERLTVVGGPNSVSDAVVRQLQQHTTGSAAES